MGLFGKTDEAARLAKEAAQEEAKQAKQDAKQQKAHAKAMTVKFSDATYLGGLLDQPKKRSGDLWFTESAISLSKVQIPMGDVSSIGVGSEQIGKRKTGAVLAFGIFGLAAKGTKERGDIAVYLVDKREAYFHVDKKGAMEIRAALTPLLRELSIPFEDELTDEASAPAAPAAVSTADELTKLAQLRDQGLLTDEEFAAQKAKLLGSTP